MSDLFLFAGEKSADLHGGHLIKALRSRLPRLEIEGVAGPEMRAQGINSLLHMEDFEVMGFTDVLLAFPKLMKQFTTVRDHLLKTRPKIIMFIDYPGFNLRMAKALRQKGYRGKLIQYISPSVWAWGKQRVTQMAETLDMLLTIFPFEAKHFADTSLNVHFVGNPIKEYVRNYQYNNHWQQKIGIPQTHQLISLFPGSRLIEIKRNLTIQLEAAEMLKSDMPETVFAVSCGHSSTVPLIQEALRKSKLKINCDVFPVSKEFAYEMMRDSHSAIAKSGTVTLELALHQRPTVVMYKASMLNRLLVKYVVRPNLSHFCIVNILAGKEVFPELIANGLSSHNLYQQIKRLNEDGQERKACINECQKIHLSLHIDNTSEQVANMIENFFHDKNNP